MSKAYKTKEVATILGISEWSVREMLKSGELKGFKTGKERKLWRVTEENLNKYLKEKHG